MQLLKTMALAGPVTLLAVIMLDQARAAAPRPTGISGFSGMSGVHCTACHGGGSTPTVTLSGPGTVNAGETHTYTLTISGGQRVAGGLDVAAADGVLIASDPGTWILSGEVTHSAPRAADANGDVVFSFDWTAPATASTVTIYGAGNSVNLDGKTTGDRSSTDQLQVTVLDPGCKVRFQEFGNGLMGSGGFVPVLYGVGGDCTGSFSTHVALALGGTQGALWVGLGKGSSNLFGGDFYIDLGQPYATLFVQLQGPPGVHGGGYLDLPGINVESLSGLSLYLQGTFFDAGAIQGVSLSNGLEMTIE